MLGQGCSGHSMGIGERSVYHISGFSTVAMCREAQETPKDRREEDLIQQADGRPQFCPRPLHRAASVSWQGICFPQGK